MPIYEYECLSCGHISEVLRDHIDDAEYAPCPKCGMGARRIISCSNFQLKGNGWSKDGYSKDRKPRGKDKDGKGSGGT